MAFSRQTGRPEGWKNQSFSRFSGFARARARINGTRERNCPPTELISPRSRSATGLIDRAREGERGGEGQGSSPCRPTWLLCAVLSFLFLARTRKLIKTRLRACLLPRTTRVLELLRRVRLTRCIAKLKFSGQRYVGLRWHAAGSLSLQRVYRRPVILPP